jgi:hypothetical protein
VASSVASGTILAAGRAPTRLSTTGTAVVNHAATGVEPPKPDCGYDVRRKTGQSAGLVPGRRTSPTLQHPQH